MIDLTAENAADAVFIQITSMEPTHARSNMIREFARMFWSQLSEEHRNAYRRCYANPEQDSGDESYLAGEAAYQRGMNKQDRETMDF